MEISNAIFDGMAIIGVLCGWLSGYTFIKLYKNRTDFQYNHSLFLVLGIVYMLSGLLFFMALIRIDGLAIMSPFALWMRPLIIGMQILPYFIAVEMRKRT